MNILILAAGYGKRMQELTENTPKPLLPFRKKNLLSYALDMAQAIQEEDIYINVHYQSDQIIRFVHENYPNVKISDETSQILDTGGGIKEILSKGKDLLIFNSDNYWQLDFLSDLKSGIDFFNKNPEITNLLFTCSSFDTYFDLNLQLTGLCQDKEIFDLHQNSKNQLIIPSDNYNTQFQGCHLIRENCLKNYPNVFPLQDQWRQASKDQTIYGFSCSAHVTHVGTKELYLKHSG